MTPEYRLGLAVFDLDGTLLSTRSPYGYVHQALGVEAQAAAVYARYKAGELTYMEWGQEEIALWRGQSAERIKAITAAIPYRPGAREVVAQLRRAGVAVALLSAGFDLHVTQRARELGVDEAIFNRLEVRDGRLTGAFGGGVDGHEKGELIGALQDRFGASPMETLAAGDTRYDIPMFVRAAVSIAVDPADPSVVEAADFELPGGDWRLAWGLIEELRPGWLPKI